MVTPPRIVLTLLLALTLPAGLSGCGNSGKLFLPPPPASQVPEKAPNATTPAAAPVPVTKAATSAEAKTKADAAPTPASDAGAVDGTKP